jgi:hypothetical protein
MKLAKECGQRKAAFVCFLAVSRKEGKKTYNLMSWYRSHTSSSCGFIGLIAPKWQVLSFQPAWFSLPHGCGVCFPLLSRSPCSGLL